MKVNTVLMVICAAFIPVRASYLSTNILAPGARWSFRDVTSKDINKVFTEKGKEAPRSLSGDRILAYLKSPTNRIQARWPTRRRLLALHVIAQSLNKSQYSNYVQNLMQTLLRSRANLRYNANYEQRDIKRSLDGEQSKDITLGDLADILGGIRRQKGESPTNRLSTLRFT